MMNGIEFLTLGRHGKARLRVADSGGMGSRDSSFGDKVQL
jgi:hypothetical protein